MRSFLTASAFVCLLSLASCQHQQQIDPAYLQQYYAQVAQAAGGARVAGGEVTPIFEQSGNAANQQPQYLAPVQQIRVKDAVAQQVRAQQQQLQQQPQQQQQYVAPTVRQYLQQPQQQQQPQYVPQPQEHRFRPQNEQTKQTLAVPRRPQYQNAAAQEEARQNKEDEESYENPSYNFGFDVKDDEFTNYQNRKESREGNVIKGSYSVVDSDGFIRTVTYTADPKEGFKAEVVRTPTDIVVKIPTPAPATHQPRNPHQQQGGRVVAQQQPEYQQQPSQYRAAPQKHQHQQQQPQYQYE